LKVIKNINYQRRIPPGSKRRGGLLLEAMIASIAIGAATILAATVMVSVNANRRTAERLQLATEELNNQLERLTVRPWSELTPEAVKEIRITSSTATVLPNGELRIHLHEVEKPAPAKRLSAELRWQDRGDMWRPPVRMTAWVFAPREGD
jgi:hypothetical protein